MDSPAVSSLPPLLGKAFPPNGLPAPEIETLLALERIIDADIAPAAAAYDAQGRYPSSSVAALKRSLHKLNRATKTRAHGKSRRAS